MKQEEETDSHSDGSDVESVPWFTYPRAKPLLLRFRGQVGTGKAKPPSFGCNAPGQTFPEENEDLTPATVISKDEIVTSGDKGSVDGDRGTKSECLPIKEPKQLQGNGDDKLKTKTPHKLRTPLVEVKNVHKDDDPVSHRKENIGSQHNKELPSDIFLKMLYGGKGEELHDVNKPARVLQSILNTGRVPKKTSESDKLKQDDQLLLSRMYPQKEIIKNGQKTPAGGRALSGIGESNHEKLSSLKDKHVSIEKNKNANSGFSIRSGSASEQKILTVKNVEYIILSRIGRGGSSQVFQVLHKKTSQLLAVKCVDLADADPATAEGYLKEIELLSQLQMSSRVIKLVDHEYLQSEQILYVVMEKGDTDLSTLLKQFAKTKDISIPLIIYYWTEMLQAVKEIHNNGIVHADLKPANFLLVCGRLKLIDFGIASAMQNDVTSVVKNSVHGTCNYISPEAVQDPGDASRTKVGYKSDVWSLGCILYNLVYGKTPFQHITNNFAKLQVIANPNHQISFPPVGEECPPSLVRAMKLCLTYDAKKRPTVAELLAIRYICSDKHCNGMLKS